MSIPIRVCALSMLLVCSIFFANAQSTGCYVDNGVGGQPQIFYTREPGSQTNPVKFFNYNSYPVNCPQGASSSTSHAVNLGNATSPSTMCFAQRKPEWANRPDNNANNAGEYILNGRLVRYRLEQCPIDDYIPYALVGLAGVGVFALRRKVA